MNHETAENEHQEHGEHHPEHHLEFHIHSFAEVYRSHGGWDGGRPRWAEWTTS
jgi:hypothetical protein